MGYSSLSRLKSLPIHTLKIDKLFVNDIEPRMKKIIIVDTIIELARQLDLNIIAEGIETEVQLQYLLRKGCNLGQGYLLSKPLSRTDFEKLAYL